MRDCHSALTLAGYCAVHAGKCPPAAVLTVDLRDFSSLNCTLIRGGILPDMDNSSMFQLNPPALQGLSSKVCRKKKFWDIRMEYAGMDFFFLALRFFYGTRKEAVFSLYLVMKFIEDTTQTFLSCCFYFL